MKQKEYITDLFKLEITFKMRNCKNGISQKSYFDNR